MSCVTWARNPQLHTSAALSDSQFHLPHSSLVLALCAVMCMFLKLFTIKLGILGFSFVVTWNRLFMVDLFCPMLLYGVWCSFYYKERTQFNVSAEEPLKNPARPERWVRQWCIFEGINNSCWRRILHRARACHDHVTRAMTAATPTATAHHAT